MDQEYLSNIVESSYIDEGLGSRIISRGMSAAKRFGGMTGAAVQNPAYTKVESLWYGFVQNVASLLDRFVKREANRLKASKPSLTPEQLEQVKELEELQSMLTPSYLGVYQWNTITSPSNKSRTFYELAKEGYVTQTLAGGSGNPAENIISVYRNDIIRAFNKFVGDAMKVTGTNKDYVLKIVSDMDRKWATILNKVKQVSSPKTLPDTAMAAGATPTGKDIGPDPTQPPSQVPPTIPPPSTPKTPTGGTGGEAGTPSFGGKISPQANDQVKVMNKIVDIIIDTVQSDPNSQKFMSKDVELPSDWEAPPLTKKTNEAEEPEQSMGSDKEEGGDDFVDVPGEFLYNFHGRWRKRHSFAIEMKPSKNVDPNVTLSNGKTKNLKVIWSCQQHNNEIYVKSMDVTKQTTPDGKETVKPASKTSTDLIFSFTDNKVEPRDKDNQAAASGNFAKVIWKIAYPMDDDFFAKADPKLVNELTSKSNALFRALYAVVYRKAMEFKPKKSLSNLFPLEMSDDGSKVILNLGQGKSANLSFKEIEHHLKDHGDPQHETWVQSLNAIGFFDKHPDFIDFATPLPKDASKEIPPTHTAKAAPGTPSMVAPDIKNPKPGDKFIVSAPGKEEFEITISNVNGDEIGIELDNYDQKQTTNKSDWNDYVEKGYIKPNPGSETGTPPEKAQTSTPVSNEPEPAKVSTEPTAPVSTAGKQENELLNPKPGQQVVVGIRDFQITSVTPNNVHLKQIDGNKEYDLDMEGYKAAVEMGKIKSKSDSHPKPEVAPAKAELPVVDKAKKTITWKGKTYKFGQNMPSNVYPLLKQMGIDMTQWKKKPMKEWLINPYQKVNLI